ncbi:hypothetical protein D3C78_1659340 [compost metagenome]
MTLIGSSKQRFGHEQAGVIITHHRPTGARIMLAGILKILTTQIAKHTCTPITGIYRYGFPQIGLCFTVPIDRKHHGQTGNLSIRVLSQHRGMGAKAPDKVLTTTLLKLIPL